MAFPTYDYLNSLANGMVTIDFTPYLNSGVISQDQFNALTNTNKESVNSFNELFD